MQQQDIVFPTEGFTCKYPGLPDHSRLEIFRHTGYIPGEGRHAMARAICYRQRGEMRKHYYEGQEDQPGAL